MTYWVRALLMANVAVFVVTSTQPQVMNFLAYFPGLTFQRPWTLITYQFVHGGFGHLFFNMWALFFFGPRVEARLGSKPFIQLYFFSGMMGAVLTAALDPFAGYVFLVGASGSVLGVSLAFARFWPETKILLFFVIPMSMRTMVVALTVISIAGGYSSFQDGIGHFGHLGGFVGAYIYLRWLTWNSDAERFKRKTYDHVKPSVKSDSDLTARVNSVDIQSMHELNREEFVRLKNKIVSEGIRALTLDERAFLDRFC